MGGRGTQSPQAKKRAGIIVQKAVNWAKSQVGSKAYGRGAWNETFYWGTAKCNLFVAHAFNKGNPEEKPFPKTRSQSILTKWSGRLRYFSAAEIYAGKLPNFKRVKVPQPGDIAADGMHVGIVSGKGKTISASTLTDTIVENDWGFRGKNKRPADGVRFYRYTGENK